jgi:ubiquinone/menaquinone biosynthesis C-methylase UbiE
VIIAAVMRKTEGHMTQPVADVEDVNEEVRRWYSANAKSFQDAAAVEKAFRDLSAAEQRRLNAFKLWHLSEGGLLPVEGKRVLEFGCGHGRMALEFSGYESYLGVDVCEELVIMGRERIARAGVAERAQLVVSDCLAFVGPEAHFDVVCSLGMFAHVVDPEAVLAKMYYHLKPGGVLLIDSHASSPLYDSIRNWRRRLFPRLGVTGGRSLVFSEKQIHELFAKVGLRDTRVVMREYPLLGGLYARMGWKWILNMRNELSTRPVLNVFGTALFARGARASRTVVV